MEDRSQFVEDNRVYNVKYKYQKSVVWAITYVDGVEVTASGTDEESAYWAIQQKVYQQLNFRL